MFGFAQFESGGRQRRLVSAGNEGETDRSRKAGGQMDGGWREDGAAVFTQNEILWFDFGAEIEERRKDCEN